MIVCDCWLFLSFMKISSGRSVAMETLVLIAFLSAAVVGSVTVPHVVRYLVDRQPIRFQKKNS